ncbi:MAG: hypothetical protein AAF363_08470 [Bacteroidota bacterium]
MKLQLFIILILLLIGCKNERAFEWSEELEQMTGKDLKEWVEKSPFSGQLNETEDDKNKIVIDNRNQVFPLLGKFINENDNFRDYIGRNGDLYQKEVLLYEDLQFGTSFVYTALMYGPEELFLKDYYSEMGSVAFSGQNAINEHYSAKLSETNLFEKNDKYKTAIYWVNTNNKTYLSGFYQEGKLVFQFGFPCSTDEKLKGIEKIKEISRALNLNVKEWNEATKEKLKLNDNPQSFWENPYLGIYLSEYTIPEVRVKIRNTAFKELASKYSDEKGVDYLFAYENDNQEYTISFKRDQSTLNEKQYESTFAGSKFISLNDLPSGKLFITKEEIVDGRVTTNTETYFKNNSILKIQINYPEKDLKAQEQLLDILGNLKISKF